MLEDGPGLKLFFPLCGVTPFSLMKAAHSDGQKKDSKRLQTHSHITTVSSDPHSTDGNNKKQLYTSGLLPFKIKI